MLDIDRPGSGERRQMRSLNLRGERQERLPKRRLVSRHSRIIERCPAERRMKEKTHYIRGAYAEDDRCLRIPRRGRGDGERRKRRGRPAGGARALGTGRSRQGRPRTAPRRRQFCDSREDRLRQTGPWHRRAKGGSARLRTAGSVLGISRLSAGQDGIYGPGRKRAHGARLGVPWDTGLAIQATGYERRVPAAAIAVPLLPGNSLGETDAAPGFAGSAWFTSDRPVGDARGGRTSRVLPRCRDAPSCARRSDSPMAFAAASSGDETAGPNANTYELGNYHDVAGIQVPARIKRGNDSSDAQVEVNPAYDRSLFTTPPSPDATVDSWRREPRRRFADSDQSRRRSNHGRPSSGVTVRRSNVIGV